MASSFLRKLAAFREAILRPNTPQMEEATLIGALIGGASFGFFLTRWCFEPHLKRIQKVLEEHREHSARSAARSAARTAGGKDA